MNRYLTMLGIVLAVLAAVFQLANILTSAIILILIAAVILIGVGVITGQ
jgi:phosphatidylserine synthase